MHTFVYGSRVIENEQQIRLERRVKTFGNFVGTVVKFFVAFLFFVVLNTLLSNLAQHADGLFTVNTYRFLQESVRVFFVDNAFTTTSFMCQFAISLLTATFVCAAEFGLVLRTLGAGDKPEKEHSDHKACEYQPRTVNGYSIVSYKQKVCFLS